MARDPRREDRDPLILDLDETPLPAAPEPAEAPPVGEPGEADDPAARHLLRRAARGRGGGIGRVALGAAAGLAALAVGVGLHDFVAGLLARSALLGWPALALAGVLAGALVAAVAAEIAALARLGRIEGIRADATSAAETGLAAPADRALAALSALYAARPELADRAARAGAIPVEIPDPPARLAAAERLWMPPLDRAAEAAVARAARSVAATTALLPTPAIDLAAVLYTNARMIRAIARIYGGRAGWLGSWRLLRAVAGHLVATGAISATDDILGPMVGGGVLGRLSRRFGEAAVNAALTARVGVAAMQVCRPVPFASEAPPRASSIVLTAIGGWRGRGGAGR